MSSDLHCFWWEVSLQYYFCSLIFLFSACWLSKFINFCFQKVDWNMAGCVFSVFIFYDAVIVATAAPLTVVFVVLTSCNYWVLFLIKFGKILPVFPQIFFLLLYFSPLLWDFNYCWYYLTVHLCISLCFVLNNFYWATFKFYDPFLCRPNMILIPTKEFMISENVLYSIFFSYYFNFFLTDHIFIL